jgi:two-component system LytT family response regulator
MMKTAVIIEDELNARALLRRYLEKYCQIKITGEAETVLAGVEMILEQKPDMIFLDISLPDHNGFELIRRLQPVVFEVIFVTAYDQYALQAIRMSAVDYLLKPIDISELKLAVQKAGERIDYKRKNHNLTILLENLGHTDKRRIAIADGHSYVYEDVANIVRLRAQGRYTEVYTLQGKKYTITRNLGEFDKMLSQYRFLRVHHSHLVNPEHIISYEKHDGGFLLMKDKSSVEVSRKNREALITFLKDG